MCFYSLHAPFQSLLVNAKEVRKCSEETAHIHASQHGPEQTLVACPDTYPLRHCGIPGQNGRFVFTDVSEETGIEEFDL